MQKELKQLRDRLEDIAGQWNGDESGRLEERALAAKECLDLLSRIETIISEEIVTA